MNKNQIELLTAAVIETLHKYADSRFVGTLDSLFGEVSKHWIANWTNEDENTVIEILKFLGAVSHSTHPVTQHFIKISYSPIYKKFDDFESSSQIEALYPILHEYWEFGASWLREVWNYEMSLDPSEIDAVASENVRIEIPASDRLVTIDHNQSAAREVAEALEALELDVYRNNEAFPDDPAAREVAVAEISALRRIWQATAIRIAAFKEHAASALRWVGEKSASVAIAEACKHIIKLIFGW